MQETRTKFVPLNNPTVQINTISTQSGSRAQSLVGTFLSDARHPEVDFLHSFGREILEILGQIVSLRVRTLSNTNFVQSRHIKREKGSLPVYVPRRSKTSLLKLPFNGRSERYHIDCRERLGEAVSRLSSSFCV